MNTATPNIFIVKRSEISGRLDPNYIQKSQLLQKAIKKAKCGFDSFSKSINYIQYGTSKAANTDKSGVPIIRMNNIQNGEWDFSNLKDIELPEKEINLYKLEKGDILVNRTNSKELVGKCSVFKEEGVMVFASYLIRVRVKQDKLLPIFATTFLQLPLGRLQIDGISRQIIGMTNINAEEIKQLLIPSLSIEEQEKVVSIIDLAYAAKKAKEAEAQHLLNSIDDYLLQELAIELPEEEKNSIQERMFFRKFSEVSGGRFDPFYSIPYLVKLDTLFKNITGKRLKNYMVSCSSGATPSKKDADIHYTTKKNGFPFIRVQNLSTTGRLNLTNLKYITDATHNGLLKRSQVFAGDLLVKITGVGRMAIASVAPQGFEGNINQHIVVIKTGSAEISQQLANFLNLNSVEMIASKRATGGTRPALDYPALFSIPIALPPSERRQEIATHIEAIRHQAKQLRKQAVADLEQAKQKVETMILGEAGQ